jgi:leucyl/phenylalanyl-tRNA--protein transferase
MRGQVRRMTLSPELLLHAYGMGIFPMAEHQDSMDLFWLDPKRRGIMPLDNFHISRSLARRMRRGGYCVTIDQCFDQVVAACADRSETWINPQIQEAYQRLHDLGHAHSLEIHVGTELVGGVYGVTLGAAFFGESMFSRRTDASKIALAYLVDHLSRAGFHLFDTQFLTDHLASLGAQEISRARYQELLADAISRNAQFTKPAMPSAQDVIQRNTQTSYRE